MDQERQTVKSPPQTSREIERSPISLAAVSIASGCEHVSRSVTTTVVIVGASASGGVGSHLTMADAICEIIDCRHVSVVELQDLFLCERPYSSAMTQLIRARELSPSAIIAIDLFYWLAEDGELFSRVLDSIATIECPIVIGSVPALGPAALFSERDALNKQLRQWAKENSVATVLDVDGLLEARGQADLLSDGLHPLAKGMRELAKSAVMSLRSIAPRSWGLLAASEPR